MKQTPDREWIRARLPGARNDGPPGRGDHDLNPDMSRSATNGRKLVPAAVLVPLVERTDNTTVLLTKRTEHLAHHPGQISFPGGHIEAEDASPEDTALRETEEETGLSRRHVDIIGRLDDYETRTGFRVTPIVGMVRPPFEISPDPHEVAEVFEVPLSFFLDKSNHQRHQSEFNGRVREFFAMPYGDYYIWGATAGMLVNLYEVLKGK